MIKLLRASGFPFLWLPPGKLPKNVPKAYLKYTSCLKQIYIPSQILKKSYRITDTADENIEDIFLTVESGHTQPMAGGPAEAWAIYHDKQNIGDVKFNSIHTQPCCLP